MITTALFIVGLLLVIFVGFVSWAGRTDKKLAHVEAEYFRRDAYNARGTDAWPLLNVYQADAEADARGEGYLPLWIRFMLLIIGIGLMVPAIVLWCSK